MKKIFRLLFTLILVFPLVTNARNLDNLKHRWTNEFASNSNAYYEHDNVIGIQFYDELYMIDKITGETKKTNFAEVTYKIQEYNGKYLNLTQKTNSDNSYTSTIYEVNELLEITNEVSINLANEYINDIEIYDNYILLTTNIGNIYELSEDFKIVNTLTNLDGSYLTKISSTQYELFDKDGTSIKKIDYEIVLKFKDGYLGVNSEYNSQQYGTYIHTFDYWDEKFENKIDNKTYIINRDYSSTEARNIAGKIYLYKYGSYIEVKEDLTYESISYPYMTEEEDKKSFIINSFEEEIEENLYNKGYDTNIKSLEIDKEGNIIASAIIREEADETQNYYYLAYYDSEYNLIFDKKVHYEETTADLRCRIYFRANRFDEYIVFAYHNLNEENFIEFYDLDGNLVKKEQLDISHGGIVQEVLPTENGLLLIISPGLGGCEVKNTPSTSSPTFLSAKVPNLMGTSISTIALYYEFPFEVKTKTDGNGTISSTHTVADSGENVEFEIKPKEGYKLDKVVVIDENGNKLTFNDYKFTMPSSNVTIEATFIVDNPNTSASIYISISTLLLIIGLLIIKKYKSKIDFINN